MSNVHDIGMAASSLETSKRFDGFTKVEVQTAEDVGFSVGTDSGRTYVLSCPWGTEQIAKNLLKKLRSFRYQPYDAAGAMIDPSMEIGDGVSIGGITSGAFSMNTYYGPLLSSDLSAKYEEEIDHEYPYISQQDRDFTRRIHNLRDSVESEFLVQAGQIAAKVSSKGGGTSFGWELDDTSWTLKSSGSTVLKANADGAEITGKIVATSGKIGGFDITDNAISYGGLTFGGSQETGSYFGPLGLQIGQNFQVDASGNLVASSGTFSGYVHAGNIQYGDSYGKFNGAGIVGNSITGNRLVTNTITTGYLASGINTSLGYANYSRGVLYDGDTANYARANIISAGQTMLLRGYTFGLSEIHYMNQNGTATYLKVVTWS